MYYVLGVAKCFGYNFNSDSGEVEYFKSDVEEVSDMIDKFYQIVDGYINTECYAVGDSADSLIENIKKSTIDLDGLNDWIDDTVKDDGVFGISVDWDIYEDDDDDYDDSYIFDDLTIEDVKGDKTKLDLIEYYFANDDLYEFLKFEDREEYLEYLRKSKELTEKHDEIMSEMSDLIYSINYHTSTIFHTDIRLSRIELYSEETQKELLKENDGTVNSYIEKLEKFIDDLDNRF